MFLGFIGYFVLMNVLNLATRFNFRVFNGVIHIILIYLAIKAYDRSNPEGFNYLSGVAMGIITSVIGVIPFAIFQIAFLSYNASFMEALQQAMPSIGQYLTPWTTGLIVLMEGLAVSFVASYIIMRIVESSKKVAYSQ